MTMTLDGTNGLTTPGVVNTAGETIATTLAVTGASTLTGAVTASTTLAVTGASTLTGAVTASTTLAVTGASTLTGALTATAGINAPNTFGFKNRIINGAMVIDQRNAGVAITTAGSGVFGVDRFKYESSPASKFTIQQNAGSVTPPVGFSKYLGFTTTSAYSVAAGDLFYVVQPIEGQNVSDLAWGTANASTVTLSFCVRSSLTGTFGGAISNSGQTRSYPFSYSIPVANTWTTISVTIAGDTSGTWLTTNGTGIYVFWSLGTGTTYSGTANSWAGTQYVSATGATSVVGTNGATFYITGVQLEKGSTATSFDCRDYGRELIICQRYFLAYTVASTCTSWSVNSTQNLAIGFPVQMRSLPTYTGIISGAWSGNTPGENYVCKDGYTWYYASYFYGAGSLVTGFSAEL